MNYHSIIIQCKDYIRNDPSREISAEDLADLCGYSLYHLSSVFRACLGCSIGRYITEERLRLAALQILEGRKITDVAIDCGFDTSSGFTRAFRKQFGCSPRDYRRLSPDREAEYIRSRTMMEPVRPEYVKRSALKVYGYVIPVEEDHEQAGRPAFWSNVNFRAFPSYPENASDYAEVGVWINPDAHTGRMDYFFGYITSDPRPAEGFHDIQLAAGDYAVFRLAYPAPESGQNLPARIQELWQYIFEEFFTGNTSVSFDDSRLCFEKYGAENVEIYVPYRQ